MQQEEYPVLFLVYWNSSVCAGVYIKENDQMLGHTDSSSDKTGLST